MKRRLLMMLFAMFLLGLTVWLVARDDNQRQSVDSVVFQPLPTPKLEALQRQLYEEWKKEAAEKEANIIAEKKFAGNKKK